MPPPSYNPAPSPTSVSPSSPPNLVCLPMGGHSLLRCPDLGHGPSRGCLWGGEQLLRVPSKPFGSGHWRWAAALLGSLSGSGGAGACPQLSPGSGRGLPAGSRRAPGWPGQSADLSSSPGTRPARHRESPGSVRTGTRRPASHDDIKSPPPVGPHIPAGLGGGGGGLRQEVPAGGSWEM